MKRSPALLIRSAFVVTSTTARSGGPTPPLTCRYNPRMTDDTPSRKPPLTSLTNEKTRKIESLSDAEWTPHQYQNTFCRETTTNGSVRLRIGPRERHVEVILRLAADLGEPFKVLYVLHTPRGGSTPGRYESPALDHAAVLEFFRRFGEFFAKDARHDVWLYSRPDDATLVWDRHDLLYAYGPLEKFVKLLEATGYRLAQAVPIPSPHTHNYHAEWDSSERELAALGWRATPLRPSDEQ
jgi:hypothetical protein